jgi:hypothetical protein
MKQSYWLFVALGLVAQGPVVRADQLNGSDDFDDNSRDSLKWGAADATLGNGQLEEANGHVQFTVGPNINFVDAATRTWRLNSASATNDWFVRVRVSLPDSGSLAEGAAAQLSLGIAVSGRPGNNAGLIVRQERRSGTLHREFVGAVQRSGIAVPGAGVTGPRTGTEMWCQLRYSAAGQTLHLESATLAAPDSWVELVAYAFDSTEIDWQLLAEDTFEVSLSGLAFSTLITAGDQFWFDDFSAASLPVILTQPADQTVAPCDPANFAVTVDAGPATTFQWRHAGTNLTGATGSTLLIANPTVDDAGPYEVVITNPAGSVVSREAIVELLPGGLRPSIELTGDNVRIRWALGCASDGFEVDHKESLGPGEWEPLLPPYPVVDGQYEIVLPADGPARFFRWRRDN